MTFSLIKVLATLLAIAQFTNNSPDITRSYDPNKPEVLAADLGKGCRAMFGSDKFFTADEIDAIVADLRKQVDEQNRKDAEQMVTTTAKSDAEQPNPLPKPEILDDLTDADGDLENAGDSGNDSDEEVDDSGDKTNGEGAGSSGHSEAFAQALVGIKLFKDLSFTQAIDIWDGVCRGTPVMSKLSFINWTELANTYNESVRTLPDYKFLKGYKLPETSYIYDADGKFLREFYGKEARRTWVAGKNIPAIVKQAFISAEDQNFRTHKGIEPHGVLRGFMKFIKSKKVEGGSTISQQVIKNLAVGNDVSLDRKIKEMLLTKLMENELSKDEILELYINLVNLGRGSWGAEMAAQNYFGKSVNELSIAEAAFLAGVTHSPNRYEPSVHMDRVKERQAFVLKRLVEDKAITQAQADEAAKEKLNFIPKVKAAGTSYFLNAVNAHLKEKFDKEMVKKGGLKVRTTLNPKLQKLTESALQEGLFEYEQKTGRIDWQGPVAAVPDIDIEDSNSWTGTLEGLKETYSDVSWDLAVVLRKTQSGTEVGFANGSSGSLSKKNSPQWARNILGKLAKGDVIFVKNDGNGSYSLRVPPNVQGAVVVMEPQTGRVLALSGGFSATYSPLDSTADEYNRAINAHRQPGSTLKPFTYIAALQNGFQPNTTFPNRPTYFPPVRDENGQLKCREWNPKNYSNKGASTLTMRRGLETSNNRVTAQILKSLYPENFMTGLDQVRELTKELGIYDDPYGCVSFILGSDETTLIRMTNAYAQIANGGYTVTPKFIDAMSDIADNDISLDYPGASALRSADATSIFQARYILQGVLDRGTAVRIKDLSGIVAGKTGTSNDENDAWFVGFTNDLVIGVWVGYDSRKNYYSLGREGTGGHTALPIFEKIIRPSFEKYKPATYLNDPPAGIYFAATAVATGKILGASRQDPGQGVINEAYREGTVSVENENYNSGGSENPYYYNQGDMIEGGNGVIRDRDGDEQEVEITRPPKKKAKRQPELDTEQVPYRQKDPAPEQKQKKAKKKAGFFDQIFGGSESQKGEGYKKTKKKPKKSVSPSQNAEESWFFN